MLVSVAGVLEEDPDVLVNVNILDDERHKKNLDNKTKKSGYKAYEDEEEDEFGLVSSWLDYCNSSVQCSVVALLLHSALAPFQASDNIG